MMIPGTASGRLVAVLGPSGAGKDTLIDAACRARPALIRARRVITRHADAGGEDFTSVTDDDFARQAAAGAFLFSWQAHGLSYGIPNAVTEQVRDGATVIFNGSRGALPDMLAKMPDLQVVLVKADAATLAARLASRGRESAEDISHRLTRSAHGLPQGISFAEVQNAGTVAEGTERFLAALSNLTPPQPTALSSSRDISPLAQSFSEERKT